MTDQAKILDLSSRNAEFVEKVPTDVIAEVVDIVNSFIEMEE